MCYGRKFQTAFRSMVDPVESAWAAGHQVPFGRDRSHPSRCNPTSLIQYCRVPRPQERLSNKSNDHSLLKYVQAALAGKKPSFSAAAFDPSHSPWVAAKRDFQRGATQKDFRKARTLKRILQHWLLNVEFKWKAWLTVDWSRYEHVANCVRESDRDRKTVVMKT